MNSNSRKRKSDDGTAAICGWLGAFLVLFPIYQIAVALYHLQRDGAGATWESFGPKTSTGYKGRFHFERFEFFVASARAALSPGALIFSAFCLVVGLFCYGCGGRCAAPTP